MITTTETTPRLYVGTYEKYNSGSIAGEWLDLEDYADKGDFLAACAEIHKDEEDPEFMFQDFDGFPKDLYSESHVDPLLWDWIELDDDQKEIVSALIDGMGESLEDALEHREDCTIYSGWDEITESFLEGFDIPSRLANYIDEDSIRRDLEFEGTYLETENYIVEVNY